jgi:hypothetical protein
MSSGGQRREKDFLQILTEHFDKNYFCKNHYFQKIGESYFEFDLFCKSKSNCDEFIIIEIKTIPRINDFTVRNFVLSKNQYDILRPKSSQDRFYLCVDASANLTARARQILDSNRIGLIKIDGNLLESIDEPVSLESKLQKVFDLCEESTDYEKERQIKKKNYDNLIKQLNFEIYEFTQSSQNLPNFKLRISAELIDKLKDLSHLGYSSLLIDFGKEYKNINNQNEENILILKTLGKLWDKYGQIQGAKAFTQFEKLEPVLKDTPRYRDHMVHPFQVFLMGSLIINANYDFFTSTHKKFFKDSFDDSLEYAWLMCSTFHDICYPIQKYDEINKKLFRDFLESDSPPVIFQAEKLLLQKDNLKYVDQLVALYSHFLSKGTTWKFDSICCIDDTLRSDFIEEISKKNHGLLSAIALIKKSLAEPCVQKNQKDIRFSTDIYPAALAIALHDEEVLNKIKSKISLDIMPLCFLLVYCDLVQECGRTDGEEIVELHDFLVDRNNIETTLTFAREDDYDCKTNEMKRIYKKLDKEINSSKFNFELNLIYNGSTTSEGTVNKQ